MRSIRFGLLGFAVAGLVGVFMGCSATGDTGSTPDPTDLDEAETGPGTVLPPPGDSDVDATPGVDSGTKKDGGKTDAGKDAGAPAPTPGDACKTQDEFASRTCGMCGKQEAICQATDGGLAWSDYGPCEGEMGSCLPGATQACGNCGTATCTNFCAWGTCAGQPAKSCSPGTLEHTTAGCPGGGFKSRACGDTCEWQSYSPVCKIATANELWSGGGAAYSTFMRGTDGNVYAWGLDAKGQLGDGDTADKSKIVPTSFANVVSLQVGGSTLYGFTCAAFADGSAKCWGSTSTSYTLGDGVTSTSPTGVTPTGFGANVVTMTAGYTFGCGLFADGTAQCWGANTYGQLGNASTTTSKTPVTVGLTGISQLYSSYQTVCALKGDAAYCWGYNSDGQVGDGTTTTRSTPTLVIPSGVASIAPGYWHTCAVMTDGTAKCWGENLNGELGDGTGASGAPDKTPTTVVGIDGVGASLSGVAEVCTGYGTSCARLTDGRVACWGRNADGQLGIGGTSPAMSNVPKVVGGVTSATRLVCGYNHACVIDAGGRVKCWGDNAKGQIGDGAMPADATTAQFATF